MRELIKRIRKLESVRPSTDDITVVVEFVDGTVQRMLWVDAMQLETDVVDVHGSGELAGLVKGFLLSGEQDSSKREGVNRNGETYN